MNETLELVELYVRSTAEFEQDSYFRFLERKQLMVKRAAESITEEAAGAMCTCHCGQNWKTGVRVESVCSLGQPCTASLPSSLWNGCKRISDVDAEMEAGAERTKRMRYQRGVQSPRVLFYTDALSDFYSKHTDANACSHPWEGARVGERTWTWESPLRWNEENAGKRRYEFFKVAYLTSTSLISQCCGTVDLFLTWNQQFLVEDLWFLCHPGQSEVN